jgi:Ca2+-dependent lipid-binding protein
MKFFLGMHDLLHVPVPIWVAVESVVGTVRLRCQMVSKPPYIRNVTFTLMGVPAISAVGFFFRTPSHEENLFLGVLTLLSITQSAIPLAKALPNVLDLPLISGFVQSSIAAATSIYVRSALFCLFSAQALTVLPS